MSNESSNSAFSNVDESANPSNAESESAKATSNTYSNNSSNESNNPNYSSEVNSLFLKLKSNSTSSKSINSTSTDNVSSLNSLSSSSQNISKLSEVENINNNIPSSSNDNYLTKISTNASSADVYFNDINSIASNIVKSSAGISSISNKINVLNSKIGLNQITIPDNESINKAAQAVAIDIIKVNNQKIKALTAKNSISGMSFRVKFDYDNYLNAKRAIETDVTGINTHMSNSNIAFNQGINTLNSHNSLITSYADQLSLDASDANKGVYSASTAASTAMSNQKSASSAYDNVHSLSNHLSHQVASIARSNATTANFIASEAVSLSNNANSYNQQISSISHSYSSNSSIASANNVVNSNLQVIDSNNQLINNTASNTINEINQIDVDNNIMSLGTGYLHASKAANDTTLYKSNITSAISNISSATSVAKSIAAELHAKQMALNDGANDYMPVSNMKSLDTSNNTTTYIQYYKQGYKNANKGFSNHLHQLLSNSNIDMKSTDSSYQIGFKNANHFLKGINDARKRVIKDDKEVNSKHYNYGYSSCRKLIHNSSLSKNKDTAVSLNQALLLVLGFLIGSYNN